MNSLKGIIHCKDCGKNFNFKQNNGQLQYICQTRKNKGVTGCVSPIVKEQFLIDIIEKHIILQNKQFSTSKIKLFVREIKVGENQITIFYKDGTLSKISTNQIVF